jgi:TolA-binding protein
MEMSGWHRVGCVAGMTVATWLAGAGDGYAQGGSQLPFSNMYSRPSLSPYMQLQNMALNPMQSQNIYQQQVLPQIQQQQQQLQQLQQQRQMNRMQNQVQQIQRDTRTRQIDETIRPTGHASTYQNLSHFYPTRR